MRVMIAAAIMVFGLTTTAPTRICATTSTTTCCANDAPTLLDRAMGDIGKNRLAGRIDGADGRWRCGSVKVRTSRGIGRSTGKATAPQSGAIVYAMQVHVGVVKRIQGLRYPGVGQPLGRSGNRKVGIGRIQSYRLHRLSGAIATLRAGRAVF